MSNKLAIFASGSGSNALQIIHYFENNDNVDVALIVSNKPTAKVLQHALDHNLESMVVEKDSFNNKTFIDKLVIRDIDFVILAGFLWLIPLPLIQAYPNRIINIHPSLLPKYGGKGMYGHHVHQAVKDNRDEISGMTIHLVNQEYDKGRKLFQESIDIDSHDSVDDIGRKVLKLEHKYYPRVIENYINSFN